MVSKDNNLRVKEKQFEFVSMDLPYSYEKINKKQSKSDDMVCP